MLVHESVSVRLNTIQAYLERRGLVGAEPAHRIDKETSGIVVCAKAASLVPAIRGLFAGDHPDKIYRAVVLDPQRRWEPGARATLETPLGLVKGAVLELRMGVGALSCVTHVLAISEHEHDFGRMVDLEVTIETGRQHQIRAHLALAGTPIAGDKLYGQSDEFFMATCDRPDDPALLAQLPFSRHALHAWRLKMPHPVTTKRVSFEAPLPEEIWSLFDPA